MRTRTYYRGPDAVVTSEVFIWRTTPPKIFVIRELKRVGIVRVTRPNSPDTGTWRRIIGLVAATWRC